MRRILSSINQTCFYRRVDAVKSELHDPFRSKAHLLLVSVDLRFLLHCLKNLSKSYCILRKISAEIPHFNAAALFTNDTVLPEISKTFQGHLSKVAKI